LEEVLSGSPEQSSERLESVCFVLFELSSDLLEFSDGFFRVKALTAVGTNLGADGNYRGIVAAA
jgi:hypothetical protein